MPFFCAYGISPGPCHLHVPFCCGYECKILCHVFYCVYALYHVPAALSRASFARVCYVDFSVNDCVCARAFFAVSGIVPFGSACVFGRAFGRACACDLLSAHLRVNLRPWPFIVSVSLRFHCPCASFMCLALVLCISLHPS